MLKHQFGSRRKSPTVVQLDPVMSGVESLRKTSVCQSTCENCLRLLPQTFTRITVITRPEIDSFATHTRSKRSRWTAGGKPRALERKCLNSKRERRGIVFVSRTPICSRCNSITPEQQNLAVGCLSELGHQGHSSPSPLMDDDRIEDTRTLILFKGRLISTIRHL